jgi:tryptophan 2,3-dioxygenase
MSFILISQVQELLFRMVLVDIDQVCDALRRDAHTEARRGLARVVRTQRLLVGCWDPMNAMPVDEFLAFRHVLHTASGTQSFAYRALEFRLGNKDRRQLDPHDALRFPLLGTALSAPSLYDEALRSLARLGLAVPAVVLNRDVEELYEPHTEVEDLWEAVYRGPSTHPAAYDLAESLLEVAYLHSAWRSLHLLVVERMLGNKPGTGGTTGLNWLRGINTHRFFPELWAVRTRL